MSGIPVKIINDENTIPLCNYIEMHKYHHYCSSKFSTQYCSFKKTKDKRWIALHPEEHHDTFNSIIKSLEYEMDRHYRTIDLSASQADVRVNLHLYYPLLILQGDLYVASSKKRSLTFKKSKHVQFIKQIHSERTNNIVLYQIDVITEDYLNKYLDLIDAELSQISEALKKRQDAILTSVWEISQNVKIFGAEDGSRRKYLDY